MRTVVLAMELGLEDYHRRLQFTMGAAAALMTVIAPIEFFVFAPIAAVFVFLSARFLTISGGSLLLILVFTSVIVSSYRGSSSSNSLAIEMLVSIFLLLLLSFTRSRAAFLYGFMSIFSAIALLNSLINIVTWAYGGDVFGRVLDYRPGDFLPRFNGLYGHAFSSISICISGFFASLFLNRKRTAALFIFLLPFTGSLRASLVTVFLLGLIFIALLFRRRWVFVVAYIFLLASALVSVVVLIDSSSDRFLAWSSGLVHFGSNWLLGYPGFVDQEIDENLGVSIDYLVANGNFESMLINIGAHFGLPAVLLVFALLFNAFRGALAEPREVPYVFFVCFLMFDIFLGNFLNFIPTAIFSGVVLGRLSGTRSFRGTDF